MDYEDWKFPFGKHKGQPLSSIPDTYLDWLIGEDWFVKRDYNEKWLQAIGEELATRKRSKLHVADQYDKTLEES